MITGKKSSMANCMSTLFQYKLKEECKEIKQTLHRIALKRQCPVAAVDLTFLRSRCVHACAHATKTPPLPSGPIASLCVATGTPGDIFKN